MTLTMTREDVEQYFDDFTLLWSRASDAGQAGLHADSRAHASLVRVTRPWAAAPKVSAQAAAPQHRRRRRRGRPSAPAATASHRVRASRTARSR
eukprot:4341371-Prymnesium_polylepis.1